MEPLLLHMYSKTPEWGSREHGYASTICGAQEQGICQVFTPHEGKIVHMARMIKSVAV